ncbi:uncharacterized protein BT62DRAFT_886772 [Guyanagaster necrorhizus]|uniref:TM7S3/TM198-like domain-containing protein n=1 Tax=Guyanagaster necrorhizus TaxID=856835 RepID=A0A9P7W0J1_9AGAR|nr:uncharacterized protein BT62DRAFT_886772 [Guyanagaster necrorhizus MCA 3950]KAG7449993.1 hypothetical protein BT62DRAFT_886772 [Guyanagaster necrorhizus MCA 3950]
MASAVRPQNLLLLLCLLLCHFSYVHAYVVDHSVPVLVPRKAIVSNASGTVVVVDSSTQETITQGDANDGAGDGFSPPAMLWIGCCLLIGVPLSFAGIRGWRLTTGAGIGLSAGVLSWSAIINSINSQGVSDIVLTSIILVFIFFGFCLGAFEFARVGGIILIVLNGGLAFGVRIVLLKGGLLGGSSLHVNWAIVIAFPILAGLSMIWKQRPPLLFGCASVGLFLMPLGIDLIVNKQDGMSRGLRYLFDRNTAHLADIMINGYHPKLSTQVILIVSLVATPILATAQHYVFPKPFNRHKGPPSDAELAINYPTTFEQKKVQDFFIDMWHRGSAAIEKHNNGSRFSL